MEIALFSKYYCIHCILSAICITTNFTQSYSLCLEDQKNLLLEFKTELVFNASLSTKLVTWNQSEEECCSWGGVECDAQGHVITLQLDNESISGEINDSSILFSFRHLQKLNLAWNDFGRCKIPSAIHNLTHLEHLNLSNTEFSGTVPLGLSSLTSLVSLDLSFGYFLAIENPNLKTILQNLTELRGLYLDHVEISAQGDDWGYVISSSLPKLQNLSLRGCGLSGPLHSSLSKLYSLTILRLDVNSLLTIVPHFFANFSSLTTLTLRSCSLQGSFPKMIFQIPTLQYLDLSENSNLSGTLPEFPHSRSFRTIDLSSSNFSGSLPNSISNLHFLTWIDLTYCNFIGTIPLALGNLTELTFIDLSHNSFSGSIPSFYMLKKLIHVDLSHNKLTGSISSVNFETSSNLVYLSLESNLLSGSIPLSIFGVLALETLDLSDNHFTGPITEFPTPHSSNLMAHNLSNNLVSLSLKNNSLNGSIPQSLFGVSSLKSLDLSYNHFSGPIPEFSSPHSSNMTILILKNNFLSGIIPSSLFHVPSLETLDLSYNHFSLLANEFPTPHSSSLASIDLSNNKIEGPIPESFFKLESLQYLLLSHNSFNGTVNFENFQSLLLLLDISYNNLSIDANYINSSIPAFAQLMMLSLASCNLRDIPDLRNQSYLQILDLSNNKITGEIPSWIWDIASLNNLNLSFNHLVNFQTPYHIPYLFGLLDLRSNQIRGQLPSIPAVYIDVFDNNFEGALSLSKQNYTPQYDFLSFANNRLSGPIPTSFCDAIKLEVLDLSNNKLNGNIPHCLLENLEGLGVLNLGRNNIRGDIPDTFSEKCSLQTLDLEKNNLVGNMPPSLANCKSLEVMNVGNNKMEDWFPCMIPSSLRVLVLRANKFHGEVSCDKNWPNLQIIDIASNNFSGDLYAMNFSSWRAMLQGNDVPQSGPNHLSFAGPMLNPYYVDTVTVVTKGQEVELVKILTIYTSIDFSCNNFQAEIPKTIGDLKSLYILNLSHNALTGTIPKSFSNLIQLESLDLSRNHLTGEIPKGLASLTFLSVLNLSYNELVGAIPQGSQIRTFEASSFQGNTGLCGFPLDKRCSNKTSGNSESGAGEQSYEREEIKWEYVSAALGFGVGLGSIVWLLFGCERISTIFSEKADQILECAFFVKQQNRRRVQVRRVQGNRVRMQFC